MPLQEAFRLLRVGREGQPRTLFHLHRGSRDLPLDEVLEADQFHAWNPGKRNKSPGFLSGWHVLSDKGEVRDYLKRFKRKDDIRVTRVMVGEVRDKPRSCVKLARYMTVTTDDWIAAIIHE